MGYMSHGVKGRATGVSLDGPLASEVAQQMQALGTPSRLLILGRLRERPRSVGELAADVGMELSAVSHQLRVLRHLGWVVGERRGRQVFYALHDDHVAELLDQAVFHIEHLRLAAAARPALARVS
jgi:DNA-binding transcriptional ArsR family regulator